MVESFPAYPDPLPPATSMKFFDHASNEEEKRLIQLKYERFNQWREQVGILCPKLEYPAFFEGGLVGVKCKQAIEHHEAFLFVPYAVMIDLLKCRQEQALQIVYTENPQLFSADCDEWQTQTFVLFLMYHRGIGSKSFWAPWLDSLPQVTFFSLEPADVIMATADPHLVQDIVEERKQISTMLTEFLKMLEKYPDLFPNEIRTKECYLQWYCVVATRCFGNGIPYPALIPMADNLNHSSNENSCELINTSLHLKADQESPYYTKYKYMNNYSDAFPGLNSIDVTGRFNKRNFNSNQILYSTEEYKKHSETKHIWQIPYVKETFDEDNDTPSEYDSEDEADPDKQLNNIVQMLQNLMTPQGSKSATQYLKNGQALRYFINQEKRLLTQDTKVQELDINGVPLNQTAMEIFAGDVEKTEFQGDDQTPSYLELPEDLREDSEQSDEENMDWFDQCLHADDTYFCIVNLQRKPILPGEQVYYQYGDRTNRFLLQTYGFCYSDNLQDSYLIKVKLDIDLNEPFVPHMIDFKKQFLTQEVRLKKDQICEMLMSYLRSVLKQSFFKQINQGAKILLTKPVSLAYESHCCKYYLQILEFLQVNLEKASSLEQDLEILDREQLPWMMRNAILYRAENKKMLRNQIHLMTFVKNIIEAKDAQSFNQLVMARTEQEERSIICANQITSTDERQGELSKIERQYWQRRLLNGEYFRQIFLILNPL